MRSITATYPPKNTSLNAKAIVIRPVSVCGSCRQARSAITQDPTAISSGPLPATTTPAEGTVPPVIRETMAGVERVRGLDFLEPVVPDPQTEEELSAGVRAGLKTMYPAELFGRRSLAWSTIGAIPVGTRIDREVAKFGDQRVLVVERFDRNWQGVEPGQARKKGFMPAPGTWIARLPQEDLCQALGVPPHLKYEAEGGPSMRQCLDVLASSKQAETDRACFVKAQLAFWVLAATDGHAKNFSIAHGRGAVYALTPLYDVLSAWPVIGKGARQIPEQQAKLAMAMRSKNAHYRLHDIHAWHWRAIADGTGVPGLWDQLLNLIAAIEAAFNTVEGLLPNDFPSPVWESLRPGARSQAERFVREVNAASKDE